MRVKRVSDERKHTLATLYSTLYSSQPDTDTRQKCSSIALHLMLTRKDMSDKEPISSSSSCDALVAKEFDLQYKHSSHSCMMSTLLHYICPLRTHTHTYTRTRAHTNITIRKKTKVIWSRPFRHTNSGFTQASHPPHITINYQQPP